MTLGRKRGSGFTLIELMTAVAILALLASLAYPSYISYLVRARRAVAQADLTNAAAAMERHFTVNGSYTGPPAAAAGTTFPANSPSDTGAASAFYTLSLTAVTATTFSITATPIVGRSQALNGVMVLNQLNQKSWDRNNDGDFLDLNETNWNR